MQVPRVYTLHVQSAAVIARTREFRGSRNVADFHVYILSEHAILTPKKITTSHVNLARGRGELEISFPLRGRMCVS